MKAETNITAEDWISVDDRLPKEENYYEVKYSDGEEDEKPFRIRPAQNLFGFMTSKTVTHWRTSAGQFDLID